MKLTHAAFYVVEIGADKQREVWRWYATDRESGWCRPGDEELCPVAWAIPIRRVNLNG